VEPGPEILAVTKAKKTKSKKQKEKSKQNSLAFSVKSCPDGACFSGIFELSLLMVK
jgi:hypothetical protein